MRNPIPYEGRPKSSRGGITVRDSAGAIRGLPPLRSVTDRELEETLVSLGMPRMHAQIRHPVQRFLALRAWADVVGAGRGDPDAKARVDFMREQYARMRREQIIADTILPDDYSVI